MGLETFNNWIETKKLLQEAIDNPLLNLQQQDGDKVYFGIHDLNRYYKTHNCIPPLEFADIMDKTGEITDIDPVDSEITVHVEKDPFQFGYHSLENKSQRDRRKKKNEGVKIPAGNLIDVSHLIDGDHKVWLVVDQKTKYQSGLMKQIRKKEMKSYMDKEISGCDYNDIDAPTDTDLGIKVSYKMNNREVEPFYNFECWHPSVHKHASNWKYHLDTKKYDYYPE